MLAYLELCLIFLFQLSWLLSNNVYEIPMLMNAQSSSSGEERLYHFYFPTTTQVKQFGPFDLFEYHYI